MTGKHSRSDRWNKLVISRWQASTQWEDSTHWQVSTEWQETSCSKASRTIPNNKQYASTFINCKACFQNDLYKWHDTQSGPGSKVSWWGWGASLTANYPSYSNQYWVDNIVKLSLRANHPFWSQRYYKFVLCTFWEFPINTACDLLNAFLTSIKSKYKSWRC